MKIGIITDIHEDAERLDKAVKIIEKNNSDIIICLGDISGFDDRFYSYRFSRNLSYCIDLIKNNCKIIIPGNHDLNHLKWLPKYNTVFHFPENWYELNAKEKKKVSNGLVWIYEHDLPIEDDSNFRDLLINYYHYYILEADNFKLFFSHSIYPDLSGFITKKPVKSKSYLEHFKFINSFSCKIGFSGHLHPNGLFRIDERKDYHPKFAEVELTTDKNIQFICPCIADGIQDNGFTIVDTTARTIEAIPLRTPRHHSFLL